MKSNIKIQSIVLFLILQLGFTSGCKKNETITNPIIKSDTTLALVPLAISNQWTFSYTSYNDSGKIMTVDTVKYIIQKDTLLFGKKWAFESYWRMGLKNDDEGFWQFNSEPFLVWRYPVTSGTSYYRGGYKVTVVSTDTIVIVPAGSFHCYQYQIDYFGVLLNEFVAPGVGFVYLESGMTWFSSRPFLYEKYKLISYKLK